ncbi:biosynthetic peptidoglycan transglycosylase [Halotalea alkalilenta]|uniref:biosynthetic peptidoglycan transglycosylase n=1 Tax=Halotalea alkalilenta TaxID=376489 RepID=UPI0009EE524B|nr:biosynthetic peptidoglycan transglycosylase [Halotalea alkalilenta]
MKIKIPYCSGEPKYWFDIKGWLIFFNISLDELILDTMQPRWDSSLLYSNGLQVLERHVLALEDRYYFKHKGIDYRAVWRILRQILKNKRIGGMSTIEQQYVRTYLNRRERTFGRKFNELMLAWLLSHRVNKIRILRTYLSCAYFGYKLNGCDSASNRLFGKASNELDEREAALVASLLVYPMPKSIVFAENLIFLLHICDIDRFFTEAYKISPRWSYNIRKRMEFSLSLLGHS